MNDSAASPSICMEVTSDGSGSGLSTPATSGTENGDFEVDFILSIDVPVG
jgi:hypothetical protein